VGEPATNALLVHAAQDLDQLSDDALMLRLREGCPEAFDELVRRHQRGALQAAFRFLGCAAEAEDAAQNAFLNIYRRRDRYQARGCFRAYLFRVVVNEARAKLRQRRRQQATLRRMEEAQPGAKAPPAEEAAGDGPLQHALSRLSARQREVIALRFGADLPLEDIARALRLPLGTVKSRLFGGLRDLRRAIQGGPE
jgi:RNA polymerase sigma-70 factor (ECF subfamily)